MTRSALSTAGPARKPIRPSTRSKCWFQTCCKSPRLGQSRTCWGACSSIAACEPMPAIFSHLSAQECFRLLAFGKALQLKAMHIAIKPVRADDSQQPVRGHFCDLAQSRSQALSHTFQATESTHICQYKSRVRALLTPGFEPSMFTADPPNWFERLGVQRHCVPPSCLHEALPHDLFPLLYPLLLSLSTCPDKISQQSHIISVGNVLKAKLEWLTGWIRRYVHIC